MKKKLPAFLLILVAIAVIAAAVLYLKNANVAVLNPAGVVGEKQRSLMLFTVALGLVVIIPVFTMAAFIAWKYREGNTKAKKKYTPDWDHHRLAEITWWGIPIVIIVILSVVTWVSTRALDPYKPLASKADEIKIQVVSLDWKWLFIYPKQNIASVNFVQFPQNTPIDFEITSDSVMNSFWIPQLGGQIYSMPGMSTRLHLMADKVGSYSGSSANISGKGFAGMKFTAHASSKADFEKWVHHVKKAPQFLNASTYQKLAKPSKNMPRTYYSSVADNLYNTIVMQYMMPGMELKNSGNGAVAPPAPSPHSHPTHHMEHMDMQGMKM